MEKNNIYKKIWTLDIVMHKGRNKINKRERFEHKKVKTHAQVNQIGHTCSLTETFLL